MNFMVTVNLKYQRTVEVTVKDSTYGGTHVNLCDGISDLTISGTDEQLAQLAEAIQLHLDQKKPEYPDQQLILNAEIEMEIERRATA